MKKLCILGLLAATPVMAGGFSKDECFPKNNLNLEDNLFSLDANLDEAMFNKIIDKVGAFYAPVVAAHDGNLVFERKWSDATVNAYANQEGATWSVAMFGGLARRPEVTPDGFTLVVCHELGHHLGGFPFYDEDWAGSEGQADYFATQGCAINMWTTEKEVNATFRTSAPAVVKEKCDSVHTTEERQNLCYRSAVAGKSLANLLAALGSQPEPKFETPDPSVVATTVTSHPDGQCRLDTYFNGALCSAAFTDSIIPARGHADGQGSLGAEATAAKVSCTDANFFVDGKRPRCWFAPKLTLSVKADAVTVNEITGDGDAVWEPGETFGVNIPLVNNLFAPIEGATLTIGEPSELAPVTYPTIEVGQTAYADDAVAVGTPRDQQCGDRFSVIAKVGVGKWFQDTKLDFMLGELVIDEHLEATPETRIPDNSTTGLSSVLPGTSTAETASVKLKVDISHSYSGDLILTLISPSGKAYVVQDHLGGGQDNIKKTFDVAVAKEAIAGNWTLNVADGAADDVGTLNSWALDFMSARCAVGVQLVGIAK
jgi:hypothetical protein